MAVIPAAVWDAVQMRRDDDRPVAGAEARDQVRGLVARDARTALLQPPADKRSRGFLLPSESQPRDTTAVDVPDGSELLDARRQPGHADLG